jgi:methyl-accepting chemotaxis protein
MLSLINKSVKTKFVFLAIVSSAIPLLIVTFLSVSKSISSLEHLLAEELMNKASLVGDEIDDFFDQRISDIKVLSQADVLEGSDTQAAKQYFDEVLQANPMLNRLMVIDPQGNVSASSGDQSLIGQSLGQINSDVSAMFSKVLAGTQGDVYMTDALKSGGGLSVFVLTPITDDSNTVVEAALLGEIPMKPVENMIASFDDSVIGDKSVYLLNDDSQVIVTGDDQQALFDLFNDLKVKPEVGEATEEDGSKAYVIYEDYHGDMVMAGMADMKAHAANEALDWGIIAVAELDAIAAPAYELRNLILVVAAFGVGIAAIIANVFAGLITRPILRVRDALSDLAKGEGDLTIRLKTEGQDEVAQLASEFNGFLDKQVQLVKRIVQSAEQLTNESSQLSEAAKATKRSTDLQVDENQQMSAAVEEMTYSSKDVNDNAMSAAQDTKEADALAKEGQDIVRTTVSGIQELASEIDNAAQVIGRVEAGSHDIGSVMDVISAIAEQTNLLALNAAIEAARAGEQGRGFAVVADEVRNLASKTQESTTEIREIVERLQSESSASVRAMSASTEKTGALVEQATNAGEALEKITEAVQKVSAMSLQIASAANEQQATTSSFQDNTLKISEIADEVGQQAANLEASTESIHKIANDIHALVGRFKH